MVGSLPRSGDKIEVKLPRPAADGSKGDDRRLSTRQPLGLASLSQNEADRLRVEQNIYSVDRIF